MCGSGPAGKCSRSLTLTLSALSFSSTCVCVAQGDRLLLGLSGGKDSLALLHILIALQVEVLTAKLFAVALTGTPSLMVCSVRAEACSRGLRHRLCHSRPPDRLLRSLAPHPIRPEPGGESRTRLCNCSFRTLVSQDPYRLCRFRTTSCLSPL